jgi:hypothetical protein
VPSGTVHEQHDVGARLHGLANLVEVNLHRVAIGRGHHHGGAGAARLGDGAE